MALKILALDIETAPNVVDRWDLFSPSPVALNQIHSPGFVLSFAAKWHGKKKTQFVGLNTHSQKELAVEAWELFNEADVITGWNSDRFDIRWMNTAFREAKLQPPSPYVKLDLLKVVRKHFKLPSYKLQYVSQWLGFEGKVGHEGHSLWTKVLEYDPKAWKLMEKYNKQDTVLVEQIYDALLPWIDTHPNLNLYNGTLDGCPNCGQFNLQSRGYSFKRTGKYRRYWCTDCGKWSTGTKRVAGVEVQ
jgi:DNA polymerase elongation subunit (family B)